jgi:hypothetical protein
LSYVFLSFRFKESNIFYKSTTITGFNCFSMTNNCPMAFCFHYFWDETIYFVYLLLFPFNFILSGDSDHQHSKNNGMWSIYPQLLFQHNNKSMLIYCCYIYINKMKIVFVIQILKHGQYVFFRIGRHKSATIIVPDTKDRFIITLK